MAQTKRRPQNNEVWFILLVFAAFLLPTVGLASPSPNKPTYSAVAYRAGRADAERDISRGVLAVESWGLIADHAVWSSFQLILKKKYGIIVRRVAGCEVDNFILGHGNGYNDVSKAEITRRYGPGLLDRVYEQAERQQPKTMR